MKKLAAFLFKATAMYISMLLLFISFALMVVWDRFDTFYVPVLSLIVFIVAFLKL
ncbi:hypothetical protein QP423_06650 [Lactobacillus jensenii]|jgi:hypothetical protein|uniref:Uncharacterized protein n=2 Tax=root TaxID=1 RepID=A0AAP3M445_9LACO|nr:MULTISPECIES: hypothetical protein [Lactobacillus]DAD85304.1 MAG TPA: hypothetical protein [Myoviridae sp. ctk251]EEX27742.1 hypothetical protein HMPREF0527_00794 [Lactobacillus jensenii SJ-7A-US]MCF1778494.1 hypothetical protein [Lactobacillus jensenii]MCF1797543.1 hypothetical protein [Lactobacillus mulieris]MCF1843705.1 hypothetical protein [Lactobacillus jensenii]